MNIFLPPKLAREFRAILKRTGGKRHWTVSSTVVLLLVELSEEERAS